MLTLGDIERMTRDDGHGWGNTHVQRDLKLIELIGADVPHDGVVLAWAAYLHDWGAFPRYMLPDVPHALRSRQVAETDILPHTDFTDAQKAVLLETIEKHDYRDQRPVESREALLLREADWLDMLGVVGVVRDFAWGPNNLRLVYDRIVMHRDALVDRFTLPVARQMAAERIARMDAILAEIIDDSFNLL